MLQTVTIQNFKSLRDVTVNLQKVNLLIGPNNSGKSNFLKALAFLKEHYNHGIQPSMVDFERLFFKHKYSGNMVGLFDPIRFNFSWADLPLKKHYYQLDLLGFLLDKELAYIESAGIAQPSNNRVFDFRELEKMITKINHGNILFWNNASYISETLSNQYIQTYKGSAVEKNLLISISNQNHTVPSHRLSFQNYSRAPYVFLRDYCNDFVPGSGLLEIFNSIKIFRPDPSRITEENELFTHSQMNENCSNLLAFLDNMRDEYNHIWQAIQKDLNKCIPDFVRINFTKIKVKGKDVLGKRFGLEDRSGKTYWAEELSEGTIYFLALLAIVHQPDPPKVLLLEEPEKGIHPRRIAEVMDLIFKLAEEKDIQIIMTSHSTQVVDAFQDIPESVFVFDMEDGETKIRNLQTDIFEVDAKDAKDKGFPPIDYSKRSLSEHWAIGLLGGVPH